MKFLRIKNTILKVEEIKSIYTIDQCLVIECTEKKSYICFRLSNGSDRGIE